MSISRTLLFGSLTVSVISVVLTASIIATAGFFITQEEIEEQTQNHLISIRDQQKDYLNSHLADINKQIINYSNSLTIQSATKDFLTAFKYETRQSPSPDMERNLLDFYQQEFTMHYAERNIEIEHTANELFNALDQDAKLLQYHFISNNPYAIGQKDKLDSLESKSLYGRIHAKYHAELRSYLKAFNYYDIFIIDAETGAIIYSVFKEIDFGTSLISGPYRDSGLAEVFTKVRNNRSANAVSFSPFAPYTPSYEGPAAFIASPILDESGETIAVLAFQMPIDEINSIMTFKKEWADRGMGETGETYLVSENFKAQSVNRGIVENHANYVQSLEERNTDPKIVHAIESKKTNIGFQEINTEGVKAALNGQTGFSIYKDYRDIDVLGAYTPIEFQGSKFALLSEIDEPEAYNFKSRLLKSAMLNVFIVSLVIVSIVTLIAWRFSSQLAKQLDNAVKVAKGVARGEKVEIHSSQRRDEIGELMLALNKMQTEVIGKFEADAAESKRITSAVEAASTSIMMADAEFNIAYMNPAVREMMRIAETDLQQVLPHFKANELIGKNIDIFYIHPDHQRNSLSNLTQTLKTNIQLGRRHFALIVTPIHDDRGVRLGTIVEWTDKTAEVKIEHEVANLISAANSGDLSQRINTAEQEGFFKTISEGLNTLLEKVTGFVDDIAILFEAMSQGDLTKRIANTYQGDLEAIKSNANNSISKVTDVLSQIQSASETVQTASNEVSQGADDLSRRTESQASSLEETACSMEELTKTVKQTAENATHSNNLAIQAKSKAETGGKVVSGAIQAMDEILDASNKISDIIGVIDEIAFQTNLLALNAAVEAARAGEQGRGFAVVAGEVRSLSQRSATAAKEIKDLIRDSVYKVESGASLVNESGKMLSEIVLSVDEVAKMINDVNTAAIEQNSGINQVNQALSEMDKMTQQNAALAEETSATSRSMSEEANSMNRLISFFRISKELHNHRSQSQTEFATKIQQPLHSHEPTPKTWNKGAASFSDDEDWEDF